MSTAPAAHRAGGSCWRETPIPAPATRARRRGAPRTGGPRPAASPSTATSAKCSPSTHHVRSRAPRISTSHAASVCSQIVATRSSTYRTIGPRTRPGTPATLSTAPVTGQGVRTTRRPAGAGSVHAASTSDRGRGAASTVNVPAAISAASAGNSATIAAVETEPWPLPRTRRFAARSAADGRAMSGPATAPIWIQSAAGHGQRGASRSRGSRGRQASTTGSRARRRRRRPPPRARRGIVVVAGQRHRDVGAETGQRGEALGVAAGGDDLAAHRGAGPPAPPSARRCRSRRARGRARRAASAIRARRAIQADIAGFIAAAIVDRVGVPGARRCAGGRPPSARPSIPAACPAGRSTRGRRRPSARHRRCRGSAAARRCSCSATRPRLDRTRGWSAGREDLDDGSCRRPGRGRIDGLVAGRAVEGADDGGVHRAASYLVRITN